MKRSKFSEEQVAYALRQVEAGTPVGDVCRQLGVSEATFYAWKKKYAHLGVSELRHLAPMFHGDTLYGSTEVLSVRRSASRPGQGILTVRTDGFNQDEVKLCSFTRSVLLPCRPVAAG